MGINVPEYARYNTKPKLKKSNKEIESRNQRLCQEGLEYKCAKCGNAGEYMGKKLILELHHKNGNHNDNCIENLEFVCPNCHSQTETFSGKNKQYRD